VRAMWLIDTLLSSDYKQRPLVGNTSNIHARNERTTGLCNPFISNGSVNTPTKIGALLEAVFSIRCMQSGYKEESSWEQLVSHVVVGSNTSTAALRVVWGTEKGSLESGTVKYGLESHGTRTREWLRCGGPSAIINDSSVHSSYPRQQTRNRLAVIKIWS
jgi:hypothetical protein